MTRLNSLRNQRDDLKLELKSLAESDPARASLKSKLAPVEQEIQSIEAEFLRHESGQAELRLLTDKFAADKAAYERAFAEVEKLQSAFNMAADYVAVQERATPASEIVEDWVLPVAVGACGGGFLAGLIGFALSLLILHSPKPTQIPTAVG